MLMENRMPQSSQALRARRAAEREARSSRPRPHAFDEHYARTPTSAVWEGPHAPHRRPPFERFHRARQAVPTPLGWAWAVGISGWGEFWFLVEGPEEGKDWVRGNDRLPLQGLWEATRQVLAR